MSAASSSQISPEDKQRYLEALEIDDVQTDLVKARRQATINALRTFKGGPLLTSALSKIGEAYEALSGVDPQPRFRPSVVDNDGDEPSQDGFSDEDFEFDFENDPFGGNVSFDEGGKQGAETADRSQSRLQEEPETYGPAVGIRTRSAAEWGPFAMMAAGIGDSVANGMLRHKPVLDASADRPPRYDSEHLLETVEKVATQIAREDYPAVQSLWQYYVEPSRRSEAITRLHNQREHTIGPALCGETGENYWYALEAVLTRILADAADKGQIPRRRVAEGQKAWQFRGKVIPYEELAAAALDALSVAEGLAPMGYAKPAQPVQQNLD